MEIKVGHTYKWGSLPKLTFTIHEINRNRVYGKWSDDHPNKHLYNYSLEDMSDFELLLSDNQKIDLLLEKYNGKD